MTDYSFRYEGDPDIPLGLTVAEYRQARAQSAPKPSYRAAWLGLALTVMLMLAGIGAAYSVASSQVRRVPSIDRVPTRPDIVRAIAPNDSLHVRRCHRYSDTHVYSARTGNAYRQRMDPVAGPYWVDNRGRVVAGFDRVNCDVYSFTRRALIWAGWRG